MLFVLIFILKFTYIYIYKIDEILCYDIFTIEQNKKRKVEIT
jgi:hypothetical protein